MTTDILGIATPEGRASYLNPRGREFFGLGPEEDLGSLADFHPPGALRHLTEHGFRLSTQEGMWAGDTEVRHPKTGKVSSVSIVVVCHRDERGEVAAFSARMRPQTLSERRETTLRLQRVALVELATNPALSGGDLEAALKPILRAASACLDVDRVGAWFFGESLEAMSCQLLYERESESFERDALLSRRDYPRYFASLLRSRTVTAKDARSDPLTQELSEAYLVPLGIRSLLDAPIRRRGELIGVLCHEHRGEVREWSQDEEAFAGSLGDLVAVAVSARDEHAATLRRRELEATVLRSQRLEALGVLAGGVAHDFNNLLQGMVGHVELALRTLTSHPQVAREALEDARHVTRQGAELSRQLLAYANHRRQHSSASLSFVVEKMTPILEVSCKGRAHLVLELDRACPEAAIEPAQLQQILLNLVTNAAEASAKPSDAIRLVASRVERSSEDLRTYEGGEVLGSGSFVSLCVCDEGQGMDSALRREIFAPFFSTRGEDRGLGLPSVLGILRSIGGAIRIESEPGQGTQIEVLLPVAAERAPLEASPPGRLVPHLGEGRVLVVEDQVTVRRAAAQVLSYVGLKSVEVGEGEAAVEAFRADPASFACLLIDVGLPRISGIEVLEQLRADFPDVPAVLVTGYGDLDVEAAAERLGAPLLNKPYTIDRLVEALAQVIPAPQAPPEENRTSPRS